MQSHCCYCVEWSIKSRSAIHKLNHLLIHNIQLAITCNWTLTILHNLPCWSTYMTFHPLSHLWMLHLNIPPLAVFLPVYSITLAISVVCARISVCQFNYSITTTEFWSLVLRTTVQHYSPLFGHKYRVHASAFANTIIQYPQKKFNHLYRAVASYVTTVNQLYISLPILGYLRYLPRLVWQKSGRLYSELRSESSLELKLLLC